MDPPVGIAQLELKFMCSFHFAFSFFLSLAHSLVFLLLFIIYGFLRIILYEQMRLRIIVRSLWAGNSFDHNSHNLGTYIAKTTTTINITSASTQPASLSTVAVAGSIFWPVIHFVFEWFSKRRARLRRSIFRVLNCLLSLTTIVGGHC